MKYAIIKVTNGNYAVEAEGFIDLASAKVTYHGLCQTLWNAPDVITGEVAIVDENLDAVAGYKEFIKHEPTVQTPVETPAEETEPK